MLLKNVWWNQWDGTSVVHKVCNIKPAAVSANRTCVTNKSETLSKQKLLK